MKLPTPNDDRTLIQAAILNRKQRQQQAFTARTWDDDSEPSPDVRAWFDEAFQDPCRKTYNPDGTEIN